MSRMTRGMFGKSGPEVSKIGLGTWQFGGQWGPEFSEAKAFEILRTAIENGVDFFDTADIYGQGRSEELIGAFLRRSKARVFVATKLGRGPQPGWPENFTPHVVRAHTEASLKRLGVDRLDLTQLHCVPQDQFQVMFGALEDLKSEGKIRAYGASVESMAEALECLKYPGCTSLQIIFNIFRQKPITELFKKAQDRGCAIIVRLPLASGLLSGKLTADRQFGPEDHRSYNRNGEKFNVGETFAGVPFEKGLEIVETLRALVPEGMTMTQMALRWCADFPAVSTVIPGAKSPEQALENSLAGHFPPLPEPLHDRLSALYHTSVEPFIRGAY